MRTGKESHAELTFSDETVVRLAANTAFNFKNGTRDLNLGEGAVLVQTPKSANGATIHAATVAAAITGTTVMIEYHPGVCKFLVLEGTGRLYRPGHPRRFGSGWAGPNGDRQPERGGERSRELRYCPFS